MRILVCCNAYPPDFMGGAELVAHNVARELKRMGHTVAVFAGTISPDGCPHHLKRGQFEGLPVYRVATKAADYHGPGGANLSIANEAAFFEVLKEFAPDVIHAHNLAGLALRIPLLAAEWGLRVFVTLHDYWGFCLRNTLLRASGALCGDRSQCVACIDSLADSEFLTRLRRDTLLLSFDRVEAFIAPSRYLADQYIDAGFAAEKMVVLRNGSDSDTAAAARPHPLFTAPGDGRVKLLYAGHLGTHKGLTILLEAMAMMRQRTTTRLDLVGEGPAAPEIRGRARQLGLADQVCFRGKFDPEAMPAIHAASDILVLPSVWPENQPVCIIEAMAAGRPIVASHIGGICEQFESGREGLLVEPGNAHALAHSLDSLVADPALRQTMGEAGRQRIAQYRYCEQAAALEALFTGQVRNMPLPDRKLAVLADTATLPEETLMDCAVVPFDWLTPSQASMVDAWVLPAHRDWRLRLARRLAGPAYRPRNVAPWRRAIVESLLRGTRIGSALSKVRGVMPECPQAKD